LVGDLSKGAPHGAGWMKPFREQGVGAAELELLQSCFVDEPDCRPADAGALAQRIGELDKLPRVGVAGTGPDVPRTMEPTCGQDVERP
jgi:hypothetical protein